MQKDGMASKLRSFQDELGYLEEGASWGVVGKEAGNRPDCEARYGILER